MPEPESLPWGQDGRRAWPKPEWTQQELQVLPGQVLTVLQELPVQQPQGLPERGLQVPGPEPSELQDPVPERPDGMLLGGLPPELLRERRPWQRRHPGMRREASSRRGPQLLTRRSERIRPIPAVWLLHLWK